MVRRLWAFFDLVLLVVLCFILGCTRVREQWLLRVTTTGGIVINEAQGEGCAVGQYTARVWVGRGNSYDNVTYQVTNNAPNVILSCTRLK